ncbi:recombinase RecA, partial [Salmonella enterica subsp. enterica serovar Kokomlemle]|nr:recombinase RecA [Salmonella enterica subsp. enterica serovar Kokomlemle]
DIAAGSAGTGIAEGVFSVPKLATEDIAVGKKVYLKDGIVQTDATGGLPFVGVAWTSAANGDESVPVKLNG